MSETHRVLVTGVTGFLGSHLACRLLENGSSIVALARGSKTESAEQRVRETLRNVAGPEFDSWQSRLSVVSGDVTAPGLGLDEHGRALVSGCTETWHSAASLSFLEEERDAIFRMNLDGTRNLLDVIQALPGRRLHHISTAYVAGKRTGRVLESECATGQEFKNPYEASKCAAEVEVERAHHQGKVQATIYRPSIVVGDARTGRATHFHGVYAFIRGLWVVAQRLRRKSPNERTVRVDLRAPGSESSTLNFVPINYVVDAALEISRRPDAVEKTYHLANPVPTPNRLWLAHVCQALGIEGLRLVDPAEFEVHPPSKLESLFIRQMAFYYMYLSSEPAFDCSRTLAALEGTGIHCPEVTPEFVQKMMGWYVDLLNRKGESA